jgi:hypothetical protein
MGWDGTGHWVSSFLPAGVYHACYAYGGHLTQNPHIVDSTHPIVEGITDDILANWYYSAHGYFTNLPDNAKVIIVDHAGYPIYIEYKYGAGTVLATMQTIEWPFIAYWWGLGEPQQKLLRNEIKYAQTLATEKPLNIKAAELAKEVIGANYKWGAKGWDKDLKVFLDPMDIITKEYPYYYWNSKTGKTEVGYGPGLDCAGLIFWAYNKASGATKYKDLLNPVYYEGADGQYRNDFREKINEVDLRPGDVLFFDFVLNRDYITPQKDGLMDHVAMYVGPYYYPGGIIGGVYYPAGIYDCVHASAGKGGIVPDTVEKLKNWVINGIVGFEEFRRWTGPKVELQIEKTKGTDLIVTDPEGVTITKDVYEIPGVLYYTECDIDGDGNLDDIVSIPERKIGDYLITVVPETTDSPTDTYTLRVSANGIIVVLAENVLIRDITNLPYIIRSTETEIIPIIPATIDFDPDTLSLKSKGQWVTVYIELPVGHGYDVSMIDLASVRLNSQIQAEAKPTEIGDYDDDGIPDLMIKFDRPSVQAILEVGNVVITITGELINGSAFEGKTIIRVIS